MKVSGTGGMDAIRAYKTQVKKNKAEARQGADVRADTLEISPKAKKMQLYRSVLAGLPEVREDLTASLKKKIADGTYMPDGERIAAGILEERLLDKRI